MNNITEESENYWAGLSDGYRSVWNDEQFSNMRTLLISRKVYFDLHNFHPDDQKKIKESSSYKRGVLEATGDIKFDPIDGEPIVLLANTPFKKGFDALDYLYQLYDNMKTSEHEPVFFQMYQKLIVNNGRFVVL